MLSNTIPKAKSGTTTDFPRLKERVSIILPKESIEWMNQQVKARKYANRSHAIEVIVLEAIQKE